MSETQMRLWLMRFKGQSGVRESFIEARDQSFAERVARLKCQQLGARFMFVTEAVVADESILSTSTGTPDVEQEEIEKPSLEEQRERLARRRHTPPSAEESDGEKPGRGRVGA